MLFLKKIKNIIILNKIPYVNGIYSAELSVWENNKCIWNISVEEKGF